MAGGRVNQSLNSVEDRVIANVMPLSKGGIP
ncbi:hypothetical protein BH24ACI5_BH24ACI5_14830 [soil metagenome]